MLESAEIIQTVGGLDLQAAAQALVDLACARNGRDNITVVMMLVPCGQKQVKQKGSKYGRWLLPGLAGFFLLVLLGAGLIWMVYQFIQPILLLPKPIP
jgi:hypothetical protein